MIEVSSLDKYLGLTVLLGNSRQQALAEVGRMRVKTVMEATIIITCW